MPCACIIPQPSFPQKSIWGPILWKILHAYAEKFGKIITPLFQKEELIAWIYIINNLHTIIPCADCRNHYKEWLASHPTIELRKLSYTDQQVWIRNYFWSLHDNVSRRLGLSTIPFDYIATLYKNIDIKASIKHYEKSIETAFPLSELSLTSWKVMYGYFRKLQGVYGL